MTRTTIRSEDMTAGQVKAADLASDAVTPFDDAGLQDDIAILGFKVAANGSLAKYNLVDQTIDAFEDTSGVNAGGSTNATRNASNYYSGTSAPTGGTITTHSTYTVHSFLSGTENFTSGGGTVDILAVGGGGSGSDGGSSAAGGGGAGGFVEFSGTIASGAHSVVIGPGGAVQTTGGQHGNAGVNTTFGSIITGRGGGQGGNYNEDSPDSGGSSGGGGAYANNAYDAGDNNTPAYSGSGTNYTNTGGDAWTAGTGNSGGGGGGGAGGAASNATNKNGTNGGNGRANSIRTGVSTTYAGGGGGTSHSGGSNGAGGSGGGGAGHSSTGVAGTVNTGSGGGGASSGTSGAGGSGIAVIRFTTGALDNVGNNMILVSTTTTAQAAPTKGDIVFTYTNGAGSTTLGGNSPDVTAEYSADGGSTWTSMTLASEGSTGGHNIATAHDVTLTSTSGTSMAYRIKTLNQSATKTTRIQAVSLGWS